MESHVLLLLVLEMGLKSVKWAARKLGMKRGEET